MAYKNTEINNAVSVNQSVVKQSQFYKGFSSLDPASSTTELFDFELIKQDIINHFNTRKGERLMNPNFGSNIWDILMEPITDQVRRDISNDINTICNSDPRVTPTQLDITEYDNGYILELTLELNSTNQSSSMKLTFDQSIGLTVQQ